jgi:hypothetical protein
MCKFASAENETSDKCKTPTHVFEDPVQPLNKRFWTTLELYEFGCDFERRT